MRVAATMLPEETQVETVPFGELLGRFLLMLGQPSRRICPRGRERALVGLLCESLDDESPIVRSARYPGAVSLIVDGLHELRNAGIGEPDLKALVEQGTPPLAARMASLARIESGLRAALDENAMEPATDRALRCMELTADGPLPCEPIVAILGSEERPLYERWLRWAAQQGVKVTVLADWEPGNPALFAGSARSAARMGATIKPSDAEPRWTGALFTDKVAGERPQVCLTSAADPLAECEWALRGCMARISEGVMPYRIGILARDVETYAPLLDASAARLGVSLAVCQTLPLLVNGFAGFVLRTLEALASRDVRTLMRVARSSYVAVPYERRDVLWQGLCEAYRAREAAWETLDGWSVANEEEFPWLRQLLTWRTEAVYSGANLAGWLGRLTALVGGANMLEWSLDPQAPTRTRDRNAQTVMQRALADYAFAYDRFGKRPLELVEFVRLARKLWESETMVLRGPEQGVAFTGATSGLGEYDTLFVLGMLEGTLPRRRSEDPLLGDSLRAEIAGLLPDAAPLPTSFDKARAERDEFVRVCAAAANRLVLSYPRTDDDRDNVPAFYLEELARAVGGSVERVDYPRSRVVPPEEECRSEADLRLRCALQSPRQPAARPILGSVEGRLAVQPAPEEPLSPEELGDALTCPFQSAMRHRLRVSEPSRRSPMRRLGQLPQRANLAVQKTRDEARQALWDAVHGYVDAEYAALDPWEVNMLVAAARRLIDEWVEREFQARELWHAKGEERMADVSLGQYGLDNELKIGGRRVALQPAYPLPALSRIGPYSVLHLFEWGVPERVEDFDPGSGGGKALRYGIYLMAQVHRSGPTALEIDGMNGQRLLALLPRESHPRLRAMAPMLRTVEVEEDKRKFFMGLKNQLNQAVVAVDRGAMRPAPGDACNRCDYGELCRWSSVFGEGVEPLEEDEDDA